MKKIFSILAFIFLSFTIFAQPKLVEIKEIDKPFQGVWDKMYHSLDGGKTIINDFGVAGIYEVTGNKIISANNGEIIYVEKVFIEDGDDIIINLIHFKNKNYIWRMITTKGFPYVVVFIYSHDKFVLKEIITFKIEKEYFDGFNDELENL